MLEILSWNFITGYLWRANPFLLHADSPFVFAFIGLIVIVNNFRNTNWQNRRPAIDYEELPIIPLRLREDELDRFLRHIHYYSFLSPEGKAIFRERVREYVGNTRIVSTDHSELFDTLRAFIAASAVQLTFGLKHWELEHFHTIRIYPKDFYSRINNKQLKGGAGGNGVIWFSYKDYMAGYANQENGINLGLHEMSHALMIDMQQGNQGGAFTEAFEAMEPVAHKVMEQVRNGTDHFLRKYAGTNFYEFFAVSMEHFFEQSAEFKKQLPELYAALCNLLNQDPLQVKNDYRLRVETETVTFTGPVPITYDEPKPQKEKKRLKNYRFAKWHWSLSLLLAGIFISPWLFFAVMPSSLVKGPVLAALYFGMAIAGGILFYRRLVRTQALGVTQFVLFLLFGFAPIAVSGIFLVNRMIPVHEETETYLMNGSAIPANNAWVVGTFDKVYAPQLRTVRVNDYEKIKPGNKLVMHFHRGIFGIRYHDWNEIVEEK